MEIKQNKRNIDVVLLIDGTGSMSPIIDEVKAKAKALPRLIEKNFLDHGVEVDGLRAKVIAFRDYGIDLDPMEESRFFDLKEEVDEFNDTIDKIDAHGGGDLPEDGLEALYLAFLSDFVNGPRDRQIIVLFTDADAHVLGTGSSSPSYPKSIKDMVEFFEIWLGISKDPDIKLGRIQKRLVLYAPEHSQYQELANLVDKAYFVPVDPGQGGFGISLEEIVSTFVRVSC